MWHHGYFNEESDKHFITAQLLQNLPLVNIQSVFHAPSMHVNKTSSLDSWRLYFGSTQLSKVWVMICWRIGIQHTLQLIIPHQKCLEEWLLIANWTGKFDLRNWMKDPKSRPLLIFWKKYSHTFQLIGVRFYTQEEKVMVFRNGTRTTNLVQGELQR